MSYYIIDIREFCAYAWSSQQAERDLEFEIAHHWLDVGVRDCIKLVVFKLQLRPNVDVCALVLG